MEEERDKWVFLSHSNKDYDLVKIVRNKLEDEGSRPIMFFLKCLDDNTEVWELIRREIEARPRFILCKSRNTADPNGWVQKEFSYIIQQNKPYEVVDLDNLEVLEVSIARLLKRAKVFISASMQDAQLVEVLKKELLNASFDVIEHKVSLFGGQFNIQESITDVITGCAQKGYVICLWSHELTDHLEKEFEAAIRNTGNEGFVVPFVTDKKAYVNGRFYKDCHDSYGIYVIDASKGSDLEKARQIVAELQRLDAWKNKRGF